MITVYTISYNEELLMQFMIDHYRTRFPGCHIVVYDNMSSDKTVEIAEDNGCEVIPYDTDNQIQDRRYIEIKNSCWKNALTDWVLVCDIDELLDINTAELKAEESVNTSIIRSKGYNMVNMEDDLDIAAIKYGAREVGYDKSCLFNKKFIEEIGYEIGCHKCNPIGTIVYSSNKYRLYHYIFINEKLTIEKYRMYGARLSPENLKHRWSRHYLYTAEQIRDKYERVRSQAVKLLP